MSILKSILNIRERKSFILLFQSKFPFTVRVLIFTQHNALDIIFTKIPSAPSLKLTVTPPQVSGWSSLPLILDRSGSSTETPKPCLHPYSVLLCSRPYLRRLLFQICLLTLLPSAHLWTPSALWPAFSQLIDALQLLTVCWYFVFWNAVLRENGGITDHSNDQATLAFFVLPLALLLPLSLSSFVLK